VCRHIVSLCHRPLETTLRCGFLYVSGADSMEMGLHLSYQSTLRTVCWPAQRCWYGANGDSQEKRLLLLMTVLCLVSNTGQFSSLKFLRKTPME
jgi:hypothetical protein